MPRFRSSLSAPFDSSVFICQNLIIPRLLFHTMRNARNRYAQSSDIIEYRVLVKTSRRLEHSAEIFNVQPLESESQQSRTWARLVFAHALNNTIETTCVIRDIRLSVISDHPRHQIIRNVESSATSDHPQYQIVRKRTLAVEMCERRKEVESCTQITEIDDWHFEQMRFRNKY
jgi:hypothetical protein